MPPRKRARQAGDQEGEDGEQGLIKLADGSTLDAELPVLRVFCSCARGLPAAAQEWDLSGLLVDGQPVQRSTVAAWLACIDSVVDGTPPAAAAAAEAGDGVAAAAALTEATGLRRLLSFADAVGSSGGVLQACLSQVEELFFRVTIGEASWELRATGRGLYVSEDRHLYCHGLSEDPHPLEPAFASDQQQNDFAQLLSEQVEGLLFVAHRLQLGKLLELLHAFVFRGFTLDGAVLESYLHLVFTDRVMAAAVGSSSSSAAKNAYLSSVLSQACSCVSGTGGEFLGVRELLEVIGNPSYHESDRCLTFRARLLQPLLDLGSGDKVSVELSLFSQGRQTIRFGEHGPTLPVQLLLGHAIWDDKQYSQLVAPP